MNPDTTIAPRGLFAGISTVDIVYRVDDMPGRNTKLSIGNQLVCAGGPATNAAITFAFLGGTAALATGVGRHPLTEVIRGDLRQFGVTLHDMAPERQQTPTLASILVIRDTGERTVIASGDTTFSPLPRHCPPEAFAGINIALVDGFYLPLEMAVAEGARARGIPVVLDGGSWKPGMDELLPWVDIAICSNAFRPPDGRHGDEVFAFLHAQGIRRAAITRGEESIRYSEGAAVQEVAAPRVKAVDTLGAGDVFHGAFCYRYAQAGCTFPEALEFAGRVASFSCQYPGTRAWMEAYRDAVVSR